MIVSAYLLINTLMVTPGRALAGIALILIGLPLYHYFTKEMAAEDLHREEFVDQGALVGDRQRIQKRFRDWEDSGITGLTISGDEEALRLMAEMARLNVEPNV